MIPNDWLAVVSKPCRKEYMTEWVVEQVHRYPCLDELLSWAQGSGAEAFRAARCLEIVYEWERPLFLKYKSRFLSDWCRVTHRGPAHEEAERWVQTLCAWSIEPEVKVSELVWYLTILNHLSGQVEWAGDMLRQIVEMNDADRSPGMRALLRRMRKSLK